MAKTDIIIRVGNASHSPPSMQRLLLGYMFHPALLAIRAALLAIMGLLVIGRYLGLIH